MFGIISCSLFYVITSCWWLIVYVYLFRFDCFVLGFCYVVVLVV